MSGILSLFAVALLLMGTLALLQRRSETTLSFDLSPVGSDGELSNGYGSFEDCGGELLDRLFGPDDWDFVLRRAPKQVQRLFLSERKDLARYWLFHVRIRAKAAMRIHITHARNSDKIQPLVELRLAIDYFLFGTKCDFIAAVLWLRGPMALRSMTKQVGGLSAHLIALLAFLSKADALPGETRVGR
ncbi:MAG TPA: hypothetical protein VIW23_13780 [Candidatus Acidoferrum sp.]|jgi:hypothetical protein